MLIKLLETPEKPEHPMDFIRANLGATQADEKRIASLEKEVDDYKKEVTELKTKLEAVKAKLNEYEKPNDTNDSGEMKTMDQSIISTHATERKESENNQTNIGGAEADTIKDKIVADSEKAETPNSTAQTVDGAKVLNDSENAKVAESNTVDVKTVDSKPVASATVDADKAKADGNDATTVNTTDKDK